MTEHNHYYRDIPKWLKRLDIYRLLDLFGVTCPCAQHVAKKALVAGQRGHKDTRKDWEDIRDTAIRRLQMMDEERDDSTGKASPCPRCNAVLRPEGFVAHEWSCPAFSTFTVDSVAKPASPLDSLPTIKRSELPAWVPADAVSFSGAHGLRRIIDDTPAAPADPYMPSDEEWKDYPWANYAITLAEGAMYLFEQEPSFGKYNCNVSSRGGFMRIKDNLDLCSEWRTTKRQRPAHL